MAGFEGKTQPVQKHCFSYNLLLCLTQVFSRFLLYFKRNKKHGGYVSGQNVLREKIQQEAPFMKYVNDNWEPNVEWTEEYVSHGGGFGIPDSILTSQQQFQIWKWGRTRGLFGNRDEFCSLIETIR